MRLIAFISATLATASYGEPACNVTNLTYEITRECSARIIAIQDEHGAPIPSEEWPAALEQWTEFLQRDASSLLNYERRGVPPTARVISRGRPENVGSLYCEFDPNGTILNAYTLLDHYDETTHEFVTTGRKPEPISDGKLVEAKTYRMMVRTCY